MNGNGQQISKQLSVNVDRIKQQLGDSDDLIVKSMTGVQGWQGVLVYIDGLTDSTIIHHAILDFLISNDKPAQPVSEESGSDTLQYLKETVLAAGEVTVIGEYDELFSTCSPVWQFLCLRIAHNV